MRDPAGGAPAGGGVLALAASGAARAARMGRRRAGGAPLGGCARARPACLRAGLAFAAPAGSGAPANLGWQGCGCRPWGCAKRKWAQVLTQACHESSHVTLLSVTSWSRCHVNHTRKRGECAYFDLPPHDIFRQV